MPGKSIRVLLAVLGVLVLAMATALAYAAVQMGRQDALVAGLNVGISDLQNARVSLQEDVRRLTEERGALLASQDALRGELEGARVENDQAKVEILRLRSEGEQLRSERDRFHTERNRLIAERDGLQAERDTLRGRLAIPTPTPQPGLSPAGMAALTKVLDLDDRIESEFNVFLGHLELVVTSFDRGNFLAAQAGYTQANQSADRLKELFRARDEAARPLR